MIDIKRLYDQALTGDVDAIEALHRELTRRRIRMSVEDQKKLLSMVWCQKERWTKIYQTFGIDQEHQIHRHSRDWGTAEGRGIVQNRQNKEDFRRLVLADTKNPQQHTDITLVYSENFK